MTYIRGLTRTPEKASYWAAQSKFDDTIEVEQPASTLGCNRVQLVYSRTTPTGTREDVCVFTLSVAKTVGGGLYSVLANADMIACEARLNTLTTALAAYQANSYTLISYTWHQARANHPATEKGYETIGPAVRATTKSVVGAVSAARNADQVSPTVTFRTTSRKHWGRVYLPGITTASILGTFGRLVPGFVDAAATMFDQLNTNLTTDGMQLGVWTWKFGAFLPISQTVVDDVPDIQRRRRAKQASYRKTF